MSNETKADESYDYPQSEVHEVDDFPQDELTPNTVDDDEAEPEIEAFARASNGCNTRWRVAKSLLVLRDQVNQAAPRRSKASDGTIGDAAHCRRQSDHNPWVRDGNIGVVTAMDITHDVSGGCDAGAIAESIRESRDARVKYIIWNRRIVNSSPIDGNPAWTWRDYTGSNPHNKHCHISVKSDKSSFDSAVQWQFMQ